MSTSSRELTDTASTETAQLDQPADASAEKAAGEIHQAISHAREQLTDTVETLVDEIDLPARVMDKARQGKETAQAKIDEVKQHLHESTEAVQDKAEEATLRAKEFTHETLTKLPSPVAGRIEGLMQAVRQRPVPAAAVALGMFVLIRRLLRRGR
ncbi:MAG: hypothetical protein ABIZ05_08025 [Pseudonocardiaceae bacterium]